MELNEKYKEALAAKESGNLGGAYELLSKIVETAPHQPDYRRSLVEVCTAIAQPAERFWETAWFHANQLAQLQPDNPVAWMSLAEVCTNANKFPEAIAAYNKTTQLEPANARAWTLMGFCHAKVGNIDESMRCYNEAVQADPEYGQAHFLLSCNFTGSRHNPEKQAFHGEKGFRSERPSLTMQVESCWNAAHGFIGKGDYKKGWNYFESRLRRHIGNAHNTLPQDRFKRPLWVRETDAKVLVSHEMGFGDAFLFVRMLRPFRDKYNLQVSFEAMPPMVELLRHSFPDIEIVEYSKADETKFEYQLPMMSLPLALGLEAPLWEGAYISAPTELVEEWRTKIVEPNKLNVGFCYYGGQRNYNAQNYETDLKRSLTEKLASRIIGMDGCVFHSLQNEDTPLLPSLGFKNFLETAAAIQCMDVVVTVDTAVANLAGAMGKKTLLMNRYDTCWRWSEFTETRWFPMTRDIRQLQSGEWDTVIEEVNISLFNMKEGRLRNAANAA